MKDQQMTEDDPLWLTRKLMAKAEELMRKYKIDVKNKEKKQAFENWKHKTSVIDALEKLNLLEKKDI